MRLIKDLFELRVLTIVSEDLRVLNLLYQPFFFLGSLAVIYTSLFYTHVLYEEGPPRFSFQTIRCYC